MISNLGVFFLCLVVVVGSDSVENVDEVLNSIDNVEEFLNSVEIDDKNKEIANDSEEIENPTEKSTQNENYFDSRRFQDLQNLKKVLRMLGGSKTDPFRVVEDDPVESFLLQFLISMDQDMRTMYLDLKDEISDLKQLIKKTTPLERNVDAAQEVPGRMCTLISNNLMLASQSSTVGEVTVVKLGTFSSGTTTGHLDLKCHLQEFQGPVEVQWKIENPPDHVLIYNISGFSEWTTETLEIVFADSESSTLDKMRNGFQTFSAWTFSPEISFTLMSENVARARTLSIEFTVRNKSELNVVTESFRENDTLSSFNKSSNSLTQEWAILATPPRNRIKLSFADLDVQNCSSCECNQITISSDPNFEKDVKSFCGTLTDLEFYSESSYVFLKKGSNRDQDGVGARIFSDAFTAVNLGPFSSLQVNELVMKTFLDHLELEDQVVLSWTIETQKGHILIYEIDGFTDCKSVKSEFRLGHQHKFSPLSNQCINDNLLWSWTQEEIIEFRITSMDALSARNISMNWTSHDVSGFSRVFTDPSGTIKVSSHEGFAKDDQERKWLILATPPRNRIHLEFLSQGSFIPFDCRDFSLKISDLSGIQSETISFCKSNPREMSYISSSNMILLEYEPNYNETSGNAVRIRYNTLTEVNIGRFTKTESAEILFENYVADVEYPALVTWTVDNQPNHLLHNEIKGFSDCHRSFIQRRYVGGAFSSLNDECQTDGQLASMTLEPAVNFRFILNNESWTRNLSMHNIFVDMAEYDGHSYTEASGNISSLNYPDGYASNSIQKWMILSNHTKSKISLMFNDFEVEFGPNCQYDSLVISTFPRQPDGKKAFCGLDLPSNLSFDAYALILTFTSDDGKNARGFHLSYNIQYEYEMATINLEEMPENAKEIGFMNQLEGVYGPGNVSWTIENPKRRIFIYYINGLQNCRKENLEIRDGNLGIIASTSSYCVNETTFASWSNQSKIEFKLNLEDVQSARGVSLKWKVIDEKDFQIVFATRSGNFYAEFGINPQYSIILAISPKNRIKLTNYRVNYHYCQNNKMKASNDADFTNDIAKLCRGHSPKYVSSTNFLFISSQADNYRYTQNHQVQYDTFIAE